MLFDWSKEQLTLPLSSTRLVTKINQLKKTVLKAVRATEHRKPFRSEAKEPELAGSLLLKGLKVLIYDRNSKQDSGSRTNCAHKIC